MAAGEMKIEKAPLQVGLVEGRRYEWCSCGLSRVKPFCDGSHEGTGCLPLTFVARATEEALLCGCC